MHFKRSNFIYSLTCILLTPLFTWTANASCLFFLLLSVSSPSTMYFTLNFVSNICPKSMVLNNNSKSVSSKN